MNPQLLDFGELETSIDEMIKELQAAHSTIDSYETIIADDTETIHEQREQLAAQRRTIATLRARLSYRKGRIPPPGNEREARWIRERFDILSDFNQVTKYSDGLSHLGWHWLRKQTAKRIAAIRNFGALP